MGGGASKRETAVRVVSQETLALNKSPSIPPKPPPSKPHPTPQPTTTTTNITPYIPVGPKNGELAPIPYNSKYKNEFLGSPPLRPIEAKLSPPPAPSPILGHHSPVIASSPPTASPPKPAVAEIKSSNNRKDSFISPISRWKSNNANDADKISSHDDDQVVVEKGDSGELLEDSLIVDDESSKTKAEEYYEKFANKMKETKKKEETQPANSFALSTSPDVSRVTTHPHLHSPDDDDAGLYTAYEDFKNAGFLDVRKTAISVPTLKLAEIGAERRKTSGPVQRSPPPKAPEPVVQKHGNFDNSKFRAANNKKKNVTDSIFKQTTYDYQQSTQELNSPIPASNSIKSVSSANPAVSPSSLADLSNAESFRSSQDSPGTSTYEYSSDTSLDSPTQVMRLPTTPTNKQTFDEFEEKLISSILDEPKIESPA